MRKLQVGKDCEIGRLQVRELTVTGSLTTPADNLLADPEGRYRVITWDLPGLGQSRAIPSGDYALTRMASDLRAVVDATGTEPAILIGHSIGGMINLTLCKQNGGSPGPNVLGIVQLNTTYTNPVRTTQAMKQTRSCKNPCMSPCCTSSLQPRQ